MTSELLPPTLPLLSVVRGFDGGPEWIRRLPGAIRELREEWGLELGAPIHGGSNSWVAPAVSADGAQLVLKMAWPHREGRGEVAALRLWDGNGAVRLLRHDPERCALLLERCVPGTELDARGDLPAERRLELGAGVLRRLWSAPAAGSGLEPLAARMADYADLAEERAPLLASRFDRGLVELGVRLLRELPATAGRETVLHGDFNPENVLDAGGGRWLAIDAPAMTGDPAHDPWPLIAQVDDPFAHPDPRRVLAERFRRFADLTGLDPQRMAAWGLARGIEDGWWLVEQDGALAESTLARARILADLAQA